LILEIGANDGTHTIWFKELFPHATIHCFEPDPRAVSRFEVKTAGLTGVHLHQHVISNKVGEIDFFPSVQQVTGDDTRPWDCSGSIRQPTMHLEVHPNIEFGAPVKVSTSTLDQWCCDAAVDDIDFIWMDVQGAELDVLSGAAETLRNVHYLYTEYSVVPLYANAPSLRQILDALPGFRPHLRYTNDILLEQKK